jgi:hypothetical protein
VLPKVVRCEFLHVGGDAKGAMIGDWVISLEDISQHNSRPLSSLVQGEQRTVLANCFASGGASLSVPVLDNVAPYPRRFDPNTKPRKLLIPNHVVRIGRRKAIDL